MDEGFAKRMEDRRISFEIAKQQVALMSPEERAKIRREFKEADEKAKRIVEHGKWLTSKDL